MTKPKRKYTRWNIDKVRHFVEVESGSGCKLLSEEYVNYREKMKFICQCGNSFNRSLKAFKGQRQYVCHPCSRKTASKNTKLTFGEVKKYVETQSNCKLIESEYIKSNINMSFQCGCGKIFKTSFRNFKHEDKRQCDKCGNNNKKNLNSYTYLNIEKIVESQYGKLINYNFDSKIIEAVCRCGNKFSKKFTSNRAPYRCNKCLGTRKTKESFINDVYRLVGNEYSVLRYKSMKDRVKLRHEVCGHIWSPFPSNFTTRGRRCPKCNNSKGEEKIYKHLDILNTSYNIQYTFDNCRNKRRLPFDFNINNLLLEFDGEGHFKPFRFSKNKQKMINNLKQTQQNDLIKNQFCIDNNIPLIRIPYWEFDNIEYILDNVLKYFNIIDGECKDKDIVEKYYVRDGWCQDTYLSWNDVDKHK